MKQTLENNGAVVYLSNRYLIKSESDGVACFSIVRKAKELILGRLLSG
jgi:hypothetical protein